LRQLSSSADSETSCELIQHVAACLECQSRISTWHGQDRLDALLQSARESAGNRTNANLAGSSDGPDALTNIYGHQPLQRIGQYEILRSLGRGGGGEVFEARHSLLRRRVAVKLLTPKNSGNAMARQRFFREMESIGALDDPYIVHAYDAGEVEGTLYLAMELVEGENVESLARRVGNLPVSDACEIIRQAALGLQHIHDSGLVHRDLKPSNLLMSGSGVKIADLGLALLNREFAVGDNLTGEHTVLGTADYMAPEQAEGAHAVDIRADIYSLGCTLYRLLAGHPPFASAQNTTPIRKMWAHASEPIPEIRKLRPDVPVDLSELLQKIMAKNPDDRLSEPQQLAQALQPYCQAIDFPSLVVTSRIGLELPRSSTARDPSNSHPTVPGSGQSTQIQSTIAAGRVILPYVAVALAGMLAVGWWMRREEDPNRQLGFVPAGTRIDTPTSDPPVLPPVHSQSPPELSRVARRWQSVFDTVPSDIRWRGKANPGSWRLDDELQALVIHGNRSLRLVKLGELNDDPIGDVRIKMTVDVLSDGGSFGFFFGLREPGAESRNAIEFQAVEVLWLDRKETTRRILVRRCMTLVDGVTEAVNGERNDHVSYHLPALTERIPFEIILHNGALAEVSFGGFNCDPLCTDALNSQYVDADFRGDFGVFAKGATIEFKDPSFHRAN
jgi:serine/threonine protein kinase